MLSWTSERKPCCGPKSAASWAFRMLREQIRDVTKLAVHRRRITDDADAFAVEGGRGEQSLASKLSHALMLDYFTSAGGGSR